jgi:hypothetical protein
MVEVEAKKYTNSKRRSDSCLFHASLLLGSFLNPEHEGDIFLQNFC